MTAKKALGAAALIAALAASYDASAAGLYFSERGVRPLGRGGAFVAGADDIGAIWYNPAGLTEAGTTIMADFSWLHFTSDFKRKSQINDAGGAAHIYDYPKTSGTTPFIPIPTIGASYAFNSPKGLSIAGGLFAPYSAVTSYPLTVDGQPGPARYSLVSLDGSALTVIGGWVAYKPIEQISVGGGVEMLVGTFNSTVVFSASPTDRLIGAPEDSKYDALSGLKVGPIFAPSGNFGITVKPIKQVRIGLSGQLPFHINAPAKVNVRLPNAVEFDGAYQDGQDAHVRFNLPGIIRLGVEGRPTEQLRLEIAYVRELWSTHETIDVRPDNIKMYGIVGFPSPFGVAPISIPRHFRDTSSLRFGGEYTLGKKNRIDLRGGLSYEQSAIPNAYLSPLTIDLDKITLSAGAGFHVGDHWRIDVVLAHVFGISATVDPAEASVPRVNPVKGYDTQVEAINGGTYSARADVIGAGVEYKF
jgi:long-chain fatty acid transport protein